MSDAPPPSRRRRRRKAQAVSFSVGEQDFVQAGLARFDLHDPYHFAVSLSWRAFLLLFLGLEMAINTAFALLYLAEPGAIANARPAAFSDAFFFSLETLATVGYGVMAPATTYGHIVSALEIVTGMAFTAIMTGLVFVRFSRPKAKIVYAAHPVVAMHNGTPTLMLRLGNARPHLLTNARFALHCLVLQVSAEGLRQRSIVELPLMRPHLPLFAILWTVMHVIDEASPLQGLDPEAMVEQNLRFFATITVRDNATGQELSDLHTFGAADIRFGMRYVDAIRNIGGNRTTADYRLIGEIEPDPAAAQGTHG